jgi:hypothetical protein
MFRSTGRGLGHGRGHWRRSSFRQNNAIDARAIGGPEKCSEVVRVFDAIESEEEPVLAGLAGGQQVLDPQESPLPNDRQYALMRICPGESGELVPGFERYADTGVSAELDQPFQAIISALPRHADMIKLPGTGTDGLLDWVETV